jgi:CRISPR-associated protein Csd1
MIQELVSLSGRLRENRSVRYIHDALDNVPISITCEIDRRGNFKQFIVSGDKKDSIAEALTSKKGKARLLVDKPEELLGYGDKAIAKHKLFRDKLKDFSHLSRVSPVVAFYSTNKTKGVQAARKAFPKQVEEKLRIGNIAFKLTNDKKWIHDEPNIRKEIIENYKNTLKRLKISRFPKCSICGSSDYPVTDEFPHGMIKRVPDGQSSGCALVAYNEKVFESYDLEGNENASICTHCARAYVDALNWLLSTGTKKKTKDGKDYYGYGNRQRISEDTAAVFWLRDSIQSEELGWLDEPPNEGKIRQMIKSIESGQAALVKKARIDKFYAITLSGAAARIAVRDWIETSLPNLQANLANWFESISIGEYNKDDKKIVTQFPRFYGLVSSVKSKGGKDAQHGRIGAVLWKCAVLGTGPPLWLLSAVLNRLRAEQGNTTSERIALLKLYLDRKPDSKGGTKYMSALNELNKNKAYTCGRLFAVLESIQYHASGGNLNAGIRERFFSSASTTPSTAFGRLMKLSQHHLSKIRGDKPGLAVNLDKQMQELMCNVEGSRFPATFSLEEQASFAIGYYHQRQHDFAKTRNLEGGTNNE